MPKLCIVAYVQTQCTIALLRRKWCTEGKVYVTHKSSSW